MFLSHLNEISGGCEKIVPVSESFWSNLKFLRLIVKSSQEFKQIIQAIMKNTKLVSSWYLLRRMMIRGQLQTVLIVL